MRTAAYCFMSAAFFAAAMVFRDWVSALCFVLSFCAAWNGLGDAR